MDYLKSLVLHVPLWSECLQSGVTLEAGGVSQGLHGLRGLVVHRVGITVQVLVK